MHLPPSVRAILGRVGGALVLFWLVVTIMFALIRMAPGDPAAFLVPPTASAADAARLRTELGLDRRSPSNMHAGGALLRGDLGESFSLHEPVLRALAQARQSRSGSARHRWCSRF